MYIQVVQNKNPCKLFVALKKGLTQSSPFNHYHWATYMYGWCESEAKTGNSLAITEINMFVAIKIKKEKEQKRNPVKCYSDGKLFVWYWNSTSNWNPLGMRIWKIFCITYPSCSWKSKGVSKKEKRKLFCWHLYCACLSSNLMFKLNIVTMALILPSVPNHRMGLQYMTKPKIRPIYYAQVKDLARSILLFWVLVLGSYKHAMIYQFKLVLI